MATIKTLEEVAEDCNPAAIGGSTILEDVFDMAIAVATFLKMEELIMANAKHYGAEDIIDIEEGYPDSPLKRKTLIWIKDNIDLVPPNKL